MANIYTFANGRLMFRDKIEYANGDYVLLKDYKALEDKNKKLKSVLEKIYNQPHETGKDAQQVKIEVIKSELEKALFNVGYYKFAISTLRTRCHESARDSFDNENYEVLHIVTADELKTSNSNTDSETDRLVQLPFDAMETANMLINATYKADIPFLEKKIDRNVYSIDDLEQIAEHLLVYCKHHREDEE